MVDIRPFADADEAAVVRLWHDCGLVVPWNDPAKDVERKRACQRELFLVAEVRGRIVGSIMAGYDGHRGSVNYLAVHPDCRTSGLGRRLIERIEATLTAIGCAKINVLVRRTNPAATGFYRALDYAEDDSVVYGKRLIPDD